MKENLKGAIFIIALLLFGNAFLVLSHEQAHQRVYAKFGVDTEIGLNYMGIVTKTISPIPSEKKEVIGALNVMNEIFGYQTIAMFNSLALLVIFIKR